MSGVSNPQIISLKHPSGLTLKLMDYGATWLSCYVPLADGNMRETILGSARPLDDITQNAYMGAMVGRYTNRIANATLRLNGQNIALQKDPTKPHQLHGGPDGFNRRRWTILEQTSTAVTLNLLSPDGDQGFPGALAATAKISLSGARQITLHISATTSKPCPVCITHHPYFNLDASHIDARQHTLQIAADSYLPIDEHLLPLGHIAKVDNDFDFRQPRSIDAHWLRGEQQRRAGGYDHAYLLNRARKNNESAAMLISADGKLTLRIETTLPALQLYAGQFLAGILDREGKPFLRYAGVALEPQFLPDSPNHPEWPQPNCWLAPSEVYQHSICYDFSTS
jgi:aldose 1-epimerase